MWSPARVLPLLLLAAGCADAPVARDRRDPEVPAACLALEDRARAAVASSPLRCASDADCEPFLQHFLGCDSWAPSAVSIGELGPALEDACARWSFRPACAPAAGACREGRCGSRPRPASAPPDNHPRATPPRTEIPDCVPRSVRLPASMRGVRGTIIVKFFVSPRGVPQAWSFAPAGLPEPLTNAVIEAVTSCRWIPGTFDGKIASIWVLVPLRFQQ